MMEPTSPSYDVKGRCRRSLDHWKHITDADSFEYRTKNGPKDLVGQSYERIAHP